jgi:hypothetical protein
MRPRIDDYPANLKEISKISVEACGGYIFDGGTRPSNATPLENVQALVALVNALKVANQEYRQMADGYKTMSEGYKLMADSYHDRIQDLLGTM